MILCITPNPAIEHTWVVPSLQLGSAQHVQETLVLPSGKGVNAARVIFTLSGNPYCAGFLGGFSGSRLEKYIQELEIPAKWTWIESETRTAVAIIDPDNSKHDATLVSETGPAVAVEDWRRLTADVLSIESEFAAISGRIPHGAALAEFQNLIRSLEKRGTCVWVDTSGKGLQNALSAAPNGIKINALEAGLIINKKIKDTKSALSATHELIDRKIRNVIITMGISGAVYVTQEGAWYAEPPVVKSISSVGSGDAFMGGVLFGKSQMQTNIKILRMAVAAGAANTLTLGGGNLMLKNYLDIIQNQDLYQHQHNKTGYISSNLPNHFRIFVLIQVALHVKDCE